MGDGYKQVGTYQNVGGQRVASDKVYVDDDDG